MEDPRPREAMTPPHTCETCGLSFYYAPRLHECSTDSRTAAERVEDDKHAPTWVEECMAKQYNRP